MTDQDVDDFEFDEDGIYREKRHLDGSQPDILLDEQGIWREDPPTSFPLYTADSGLGTTSHKSTSSLYRVDAESISDDHHNLDDHRSVPGDWASSANQLDTEVYNISELEASDVGQDESRRSDGSDVESHDQHASSATPENFDGQINSSCDSAGSSDGEGFVNHRHLSLPHQSLVEFEEFEAAMDYRGSIGRSHDDADLIGAYLQRLTEQDTIEENGVCRQDATSDWLDQQMCAPQRLAHKSGSHDVSHDHSQLNSAREEGANDSSLSCQGSTQLTQIPMLSMSQSPRKTDSPRTAFNPNSHRSVSSMEGGRCLPSTPRRNPSIAPQIMIRQQSQGSEDGAAREMDVAASLLLGEEAFFAEFSGDIFRTTAEVDRVSEVSGKDEDDVEYDGQQNFDSQSRQAEELTKNEIHTQPQKGLKPGEQTRKLHDQTPPGGNVPTHSKHSLPPGCSATARNPKDMAKHVENEETLTQLQKEYNSLLRKYAEAENTIDDLRLGAKVSLYSDSPTPQQGQLGSLGAAHHAQTLSIGRVGAGSLTVPSGGHGYISSAVSSRPDSRASQLSGSIWSMHENMLEPTEPGRSSPFARDSTKLALWAKAKGVQEQTEAFKILLSEDHLTIEDQQRALQNIKNGYEKLQQSYRDAKDEHDFEVRQGILRGEGGSNGGFDDAKELEGELYKLGMVLDDLDHTVEGNNRRRPSKRVPFQGTPVKADHSINVQAMQTGGRNKLDEGEGVGLGGSVGASVGAGGGASIDGRLQELEESYGSLMERYERLKRMGKTPGRDAELSRLLKKLRDMHEGKSDVAETSASHRRHASSHWGSRHNHRPASTSSTGQEDQTELDSSDDSGSHNRDHLRSYVDKNHHQMAEPGRKGRQQPQVPVGARPWGTGRGGRSGTGDRRLRPQENAKQQFKGHLHGDRDDKDSGYMGSETSRRTQQSRGVDPRLLAPSGVSSRQDNDSLDSESESDASTVTERVRPHRPKSNSTKGGATGTSPQKSRSRRGMLSVSEVPPVGHSESEEVSRISGACATQATHTQGLSQRGQGQPNGQVTSSMVSQHIPGVDNVHSWPTTADPLVQSHNRHGNQSQQPHGLHRNHGIQPHGFHGNQGLQQTASQSSQPHGIHGNQMLQPQNLYSNQVLQPNPLLGNQLPLNVTRTNNPVRADPRTRLDNTGTNHVTPGTAAMLLAPQSRAATYGTTVSSMRPTDEFMNGTPVNPYLDAARDFFHQMNEGRGIGEPEDQYVDQKYERRNHGTCAREYIRSPYHRQQQRMYDFDGDDSTYSAAPYREPAPCRDGSHYDRTTRGYGFLSEPELPNSEQNPYFSPRDGSRRSRTGRDVEDGRYPGGRMGTRRVGSPGRIPMTETGFDQQPSVPGNVAGAVYQLTAAPCPTCGGVGYHTHGEYAYPPPPVAVQPPVVAPPPPMPASVGGTNIVGTFVPAGRPTTPSATFTPAVWNPAGQAVSNGQLTTFVVAAPTNSTQAPAHNGATYIPCQLVTPPPQQQHKRTPPVSPSVRYYVQQYGVKSKTRSPRTGHRNHHVSSSSEEEDSAELDESLSGALRTAKQLKKMSRKMKKNLSVELSRSYFETSLVSGY